MRQVVVAVEFGGVHHKVVGLLHDPDDDALRAFMTEFLAERQVGMPRASCFRTTVFPGDTPHPNTLETRVWPVQYEEFYEGRLAR